MLGDKPVIATIAVKDMEAAKKFYEGTLGLKPEEPGPDGTRFKSGDSYVFVYPSQYAGSNKATYATWAVGGDLAKIAADLKTKGVTFEQYDDIPGVTREGDIHKMGDMSAVWFKDPDGNILNMVDNQM
jgi:catechol 2,3-dioxygenase-like lactoylglutathione lyase family enzyme